jgi:hypothetical protein
LLIVSSFPYDQSKFTPEQHRNQGKSKKRMIHTPPHQKRDTATPHDFDQRNTQNCELCWGEKYTGFRNHPKVHHTCRLLRSRGIMYVRVQQQAQMLNPFCRQHDSFVPVLDSTPSSSSYHHNQRNRTNQEMQEHVGPIMEETGSLEIKASENP